MKKKEKSLKLFSEETQDTMAMAVVYGGEAPNNCHGANCVAGCGCSGSNNATVCGIVVNVNVGLACGKCENGGPQSWLFVYNTLIVNCVLLFCVVFFVL